MSVAVVIGLISQVPHRSEANFGESCQGQDVILIISIVIHCGALELFSRLLEDGVRLTPVSFVLYGLLVKHGMEHVSDPFVVSSAIAMFSKLGDVQRQDWASGG